jgi:hypothetical protein
MHFIRQWRLPILFVVSGMGTRFALMHKTGIKYVKERFIRLFIPLLTGVFIIVPPQVYIERLIQGTVIGSFVDYYPQTFDGIYPNGNFSWNHLWFLPYLLFMSLAALPLFMKLRRPDNRIIVSINNLIKKYPLSLYLFVIPLFIVEILLESRYPITMGFYGDWYAISYYFIFFITGFVLVSLGKSFWIALDKIKFVSLFLGIICFPISIWMGYGLGNTFFVSLLKIVSVWSWIITIFAFSSKYLNKESAVLKYRNEAVYPFYILHQTIIFFLGYWLMDNSMHYLWKMLIMIIGTYGFTWLVYEIIIKRIGLLRVLFGLKNR